MFYLLVPLGLCFGGLFERSLKKQRRPVFVALCATLSLFHFLNYFFCFRLREKCECHSQLPRTQPVHITAKRHKLGSQGMREVPIAFVVWSMLYATQSA